MDKRKREWDPRLAGLSQSERRRLASRALKLKHDASREEPDAGSERRSKSAKSWREWMEGDPPVFERSRARARRSVKDLMIRLIDEEGSAAATGDEPENTRPEEARGEVTQDGRSDAVPTAEPVTPRRGTVLFASAGVCTVLAKDREVRCALSKEIASVQKSGLAVGDEVLYRPRGDGSGVVDAVLPRRTVLSRPDPFLGERERVIACNIDAVVIVCSLQSPPLRRRLIDRFLIAVQRGGAEPILCVNKTDLPQSEAERARNLAELEPYRAIGIPIVLTSAESGTGLEDLRRVIGDRRCVFVGHSGVGKSSILNAIDPSLNLAAKQISESANRGAHTTTASTLYRLPGGGEVIDTPGIRQFGLWDLKRGDLRDYFPEFAEHAVVCRFRDCAHTEEPECGVKLAVGRGGIPRARYETYLRILGTLAD